MSRSSTTKIFSDTWYSVFIFFSVWDGPFKIRTIFWTQVLNLNLQKGKSLCIIPVFYRLFIEYLHCVFISVHVYTFVRCRSIVSICRCTTFNFEVEIKINWLPHYTQYANTCFKILQCIHCTSWFQCITGLNLPF